MKKNGFTLLELLVVIGIIGILVALATVSYSATQKSARDSRRKQDLVGMQNALEQYYSVNTTSPYTYPNGDCSAASTYMTSSWPKDPINDATNFYNSSTGCGVTSYCICVKMEKSGSGNSANAACNFGGLPSDYYCVKNLQ